MTAKCESAWWYSRVGGTSWSSIKTVYSIVCIPHGLYRHVQKSEQKNGLFSEGADGEYSGVMLFYSVLKSYKVLKLVVSKE
jgi:hypothetical protein